MRQRAAGIVLFAALASPVGLAEADESWKPRQGEFRVNSYTPGDQFEPRIAARPNGGFVVVWGGTQEDGPDAPDGILGNGTLGVFARLFNRAGMPIGKEFVVNQYTTGAQFRPTVAVAPNGEFVVVWTGSGDGGSGYYGGYGLFARQFARDGTPLGGDFQVNTYTTNYQSLASVAMSRRGDFVVVWQSGSYNDPAPQDGSGYGVFGRQFAASGTPLGDEFQVNSHTTGNQTLPSVASAADGDFTVVWQSRDGINFGIFGQRFDADGQPRGAEFRVNSYTPFTQSHPSISAASDGDFVVAWTGSSGQDGSFSGVFGQRFGKHAQRRGPEFRINSYTQGSQSGPCVASTADGDFVVTWTSNLQDGSATGVFGQAFGAAGARRGPEFQVNAYTTGRQSGPCVAAYASGDFVVTWESYLQDGSFGGIFGRRFEKAKNHPVVR